MATGAADPPSNYRHDVKEKPEPTTAIAKLCGAPLRKKPGQHCKALAGHRTAHFGAGRCWRHGGVKKGKDGAVADRRVTTGLTGNRYSTIGRARIRELIEQHAADPDPMNLLPEVAALRALFQDFIERYDLHTAALIDWHESFRMTKRPLSPELVAALGNVIDEREIQLKDFDEPSTEALQDCARARQLLGYLMGKEVEGKPHIVLDIADAYRVLGEVGKMVERIEKIRVGRSLTVVSADVQDRLRRQVVLINERKTWKSEELLELLGKAIWK